MKSIFTLLSALLFFSCTEILEDCLLFPAKPEIRTREISDGKVGEQYFEIIEGEVRNDPNDSSYFYFFFLEGSLPKGLTYFVEGNQLIIKGIPEDRNSGEYVIKIIMRIEARCSSFENENDVEFDCDRICLGNDTDERGYKFKISG